MGKNNNNDDREDGPALMALKAKAVVVRKKAGAEGRVDDHLGGMRKPDLTAIGLDIAKSLQSINGVLINLLDSVRAAVSSLDAPLNDPRLTYLVRPASCGGGGRGQDGGGGECWGRCPGGSNAHGGGC